MRHRAYIRSFLGIRGLENVPKHIDGCVRLNGNACKQSLFVDISDQLLGVGLLIGRLLGRLCGRGKGSLVMEAVEVTAGVLEFLDPFLRLLV